MGCFGKEKPLNLSIEYRMIVAKAIREAATVIGGMSSIANLMKRNEGLHMAVKASVSNKRFVGLIFKTIY